MIGALFPTLRTPLRYPPADLPYSSLAGYGMGRGRVVKLGALSPEVRAAANTRIERITSLGLGLERDVARLTNRGDVPPGGLATEVRLVVDEVEQLEAEIGTLDSDMAYRAEWTLWADRLENELGALRRQLDVFEGTTVTRRAQYIALGVAGAVVLGGLGAYFVYRKGR